MPIINLQVSGSEDPTLAQQLAKEITRLTKEKLYKKPELTAINITFVPENCWFIDSQSLADLNKKSFHLEIKITDSTNVKDEKASYIHAVHESLTGLLGNLHPVSYTAIHEMKADGYGFDGRTIEYNYINNQPK